MVTASSLLRQAADYLRLTTLANVSFPNLACVAEVDHAGIPFQDDTAAKQRSAGSREITGARETGVIAA